MDLTLYSAIMCLNEHIFPGLPICQPLFFLKVSQSREDLLKLTSKNQSTTLPSSAQIMEPTKFTLKI